MMAQIPSGLQALMQASQVLQQEASPVAPGPQGPQPTVASRIAQQIEQAPSMQMMGEQAGIAGAIQNQQVARNQQMAQDPRAVAQMAAQMLGIAQNPVDMQFKEGGIIGFAEGDPVVDPDVEQFEDRQIVDQIKNVLRSSGEGAVAAMKDLYPPKLFVQAIQELGEAGGRFARAFGMDIPKYTAPPAVPNIEAFFKKQDGPRGTTMRGETMTIPETLDLSQPRQPAAATVGGEDMPGTPAPVSMTTEQMMPPGAFSGRESPAAQVAGQEPQIVRADETVDTRAADKIAGIAQALQKPLTSPQATIRSLPDIMQEARGQVSPEYKEAVKTVQQKQQEELALRQARPDLEKEAAEALTRADTERKRLLELKRSTDTFNRLNALFTSLYTRGNEVEAAEKAMMAREEGAIAAQLAHDQAIIKLKEAKEARKLGDAEKATAFAKDALSHHQTEMNIINKMAEMSAKLEGDRATAATAERRIESAERLGVAQILSDATTKLEQARIRAADAKERNALRIKEAQDEVERKKLADKNREITSVQNFIKDLSSQLAGLETKYGAITKLPAAMQKQPEFAEQAARFNSDRQRLESQIQQAERRLSTLLGDEAPIRSAPSGPRQRYDASGNPIR
jgi:hypothetical protein